MIPGTKILTINYQLSIIKMDIKRGFLEAIGNTPLIRLNSFSDATGCEILGKAEFLNPGGSVKDRAALYLSKMPSDAVSSNRAVPSLKVRLEIRESGWRIFAMLRAINA
jgi:hypothetical protein